MALRLKSFGLLFLILSLPFFFPVPAQSAEEYAVGTWKTAQTIQPFYYQEFLPEKARVAVHPFTNPSDQKSVLLAGSLDMCGTTIAHAIHSASMGQPVVVVSALCNKCSALVVRKDAAIGRVEELRGKRIGYVPGTMHEILLRESLVRRGLSPGRDVRLVRVDFFDMGIALFRADIDAFLSGEPFPALAVEKGFGEILSYPYYGESIGTINAGMLVTRKLLENRPEDVYRLVRAHALSTRHLKNNPDKWLDRAADFGTDRQILAKAAGNMELAWYMDEAFVDRARALGERMESLGMISVQPDYDRLFDLSVVERVRMEIGNDE
jgi:NitT/TauT family transport system substrate-binding protein